MLLTKCYGLNLVSSFSILKSHLKSLGNFKYSHCIVITEWVIEYLEMEFFMDFSGVSDGKESTCNVGDSGLISGDPLETGMATYSCILVWEIPWTEEPSGLQSMGSQRVRHD